MSQEPIAPSTPVLTPAQTEEIKNKLQDQIRADECIKKVFEVFDQYNCEPIISVNFSSNGNNNFQLTALTKPPKEDKK